LQMCHHGQNPGRLCRPRNPTYVQYITTSAYSFNSCFNELG
jgi:hypothetical protein